MKIKALAPLLMSAAIIAGCSDESLLPGEAEVGVKYSPELSAIWTKTFPPIRLADDEKRFSYFNYDVGGAVCIEHASIDKKGLYDYLARPERCGQIDGYWRSTMIIFENDEYKVFVPEENLDFLGRNPNFFMEKHFDEFIAQFMTTAPVTPCNTAPTRSKCNPVLWGYRIANYTEADLNTNKAIVPDMTFPYYPPNIK